MELKTMIKERRMEKHMTQIQFAEKLGMKQNQLSKYENGKSKPNLDILMDMEEILDCRLRDLFEKI